MKSLIIILLYIVIVDVSGKLYYHQDRIPSDVDVYNQSKVHVIQDSRHQTKYNGYEHLCPDAANIAPCVCTYDWWDNIMDINCSAVESEEQLKQIFKADFPFKNFKKFTFHNNTNMKVLEAGVFNNISFEIIDIKLNSLEVIELEALDSCYERATNIDLRRNRITSFPFDELSHFSKLLNFDISNNLLSSIPADAFNGLTTLETLQVIANGANIVGTFQDLPNLVTIGLTYNDLPTTIPANFINIGSPDLWYIAMNGNGIVSVEPGAFDIVDGLFIDIRDNSISTLDEATWRPYLEAEGWIQASLNPLICGCDIAWLFGEDQLLEHVGEYTTTCADGQYLHDLDPTIFDQC
ncbi:unnamed protein product [Meganyctiphanes norvegica]|uniref:Oplophorus-luciferin 2-monooxygenase non-catalytic subunit n=2 Tax=Meganyctiphanes norvegica TaxID=48144 RepID=A0AAV2SSU9_MEGNR